MFLPMFALDKPSHYIPQANREIYYLWNTLRICFHNFIVEILGLAARKLGASVIVLEDYKSLISFNPAAGFTTPIPPEGVVCDTCGPNC